MQPTEGFSIPRRALDVEDYIDILRRHKGWIFGPFLLTLVVSVVGVYLWPDSYDSVAVIQIKPQQISPQLVPVLSTQDVLGRIQSLSNQVMSRSELTSMIRNMNLYPRERDRLTNEDVLEIMRGAIDLRPTGMGIGGGNSLPAFQVKFTYYNRHDASKVVSALVSKFLDQDINTRSTVNYQAVEFTEEQYNQAKDRLVKADDAMTAFRLANPGKLPDQLNANLAQMTGLQSQLTSLNSQLSGANNEKFQMENQIGLLRTRIGQLSQETKVEQSQAPKVKSPKLQQAEQRVEYLQQQLSSLRQQFTAAHPNVKTMQGQLDGAKRNLEDVLKEEALHAAEVKDDPVVTPVNVANRRTIQDTELNIQNLEGMIKSKTLDIARFEKQILDATAQMSSLNARIQSMPVGDAQWQDLAREQALAKEAYLAADANWNKAKTAQAVETRKQGEKLDLLDPASIPVDPIYPNRPMVIGIGAGLGLVLGLVMAGGREMKDSSLKNLKDVRAYTQMAILGSVPLLENDFVVRRRRRIAWLGWTVACLTAVLVMAGSIVYYYTTR